MRRKAVSRGAYGIYAILVAVMSARWLAADSGAELLVRAVGLSGFVVALAIWPRARLAPRSYVGWAAVAVICFTVT